MQTLKGRKARVLFVDDDRRLLDALSTRLSEAGCRCTACGNASEAMVQFATGFFDLVITDLTMPDIDGLAIIAMIRSQSEVPILVVTGHAEEYGRLFLGYQNVTLIRKPFDAKALVACACSLLSKWSDTCVEVKCG